ncbi:MAG: hypothetical protein OSB42_10210 [Planctomycetota bacterium]|nr:hypothetical protein [Planctomycetota bacterium]
MSLESKEHKLCNGGVQENGGQEKGVEGRGAGQESLRPDALLTLAEAALAAGVDVPRLQLAVDEGRLLHETGGRQVSGNPDLIHVRWVDVQSLVTPSEDLGVPPGPAPAEEVLLTQVQPDSKIGEVESLESGAPWEHLYRDLALRLDQSERERRAQSAALLVTQRHLLELGPGAQDSPNRTSALIGLGVVALALGGLAWNEMERADQQVIASQRLETALAQSQTVMEEVQDRATRERTSLEQRLVHATQNAEEDRQALGRSLAESEQRWVTLDASSQALLATQRESAVKSQEELRGKLDAAWTLAREERLTHRASIVETEAAMAQRMTQVAEQNDQNQKALSLQLNEARSDRDLSQQVLADSLEQLAAIQVKRAEQESRTRQLERDLAQQAARARRGEAKLAQTWQGVGSPPVPLGIVVPKFPFRLVEALDQAQGPFGWILRLFGVMFPGRDT